MIKPFKPISQPLKDRFKSVALRCQAWFSRQSHSTSPRSDWAALDAEKIAARRELLAQAPEQAQGSVNQVLHPELWELADDGEWCDRIPRNPDHTWLEDN